MRIAWLGPAPRDDQGVPAVATLLISALAQQGVDIDCFTVGRRDDLPPALLRERNVGWVLEQTRWSWDRWYSRSRGSAFLTEVLSRGATELRLAPALIRRHLARPYDLVYKFSAPETIGLARYLDRLPPLVLHSQVHAAGELHWHMREVHLAARLESAPRTVAVRAMLSLRAQAQRRAFARARMIICPSERFGSLLADDYGVARHAIRTVPNPVDLERFTPGPARRDPDEPVRLLFVGMVSVRKGVEMVVELSHRLAEGSDQVTIEVAGEPRGWSDYSALLDDLHPAVGRALGWVDPEQLPGLYRRADGLLQPSHYEPFAITVAEALASGVPVVASDVVGAAEWLSTPACRTFPAGDMDAFEQQVRQLIAQVRADRSAMSNAARSAAGVFAPDVVGRRLAAALDEAMQRR